jgi:hypothetical protein
LAGRRGLNRHAGIKGQSRGKGKRAAKRNVVRISSAGFICLTGFEFFDELLSADGMLLVDPLVFFGGLSRLTDEILGDEFAGAILPWAPTS